jgi:hypothetical protein
MLDSRVNKLIVVELAILLYLVVFAFGTTIDFATEASISSSDNYNTVSDVENIEYPDNIVYGKNLSENPTPSPANDNLVEDIKEEILTDGKNPDNNHLKDDKDSNVDEDKNNQDKIEVSPTSNPSPTSTDQMDENLDEKPEDENVRIATQKMCLTDSSEFLGVKEDYDYSLDSENVKTFIEKKYPEINNYELNEVKIFLNEDSYFNSWIIQYEDKKYAHIAENGQEIKAVECESDQTQNKSTSIDL